MTDVIDFGAYAREPDPHRMNREELQERLESVRAQIAALNEREPEDMDSEEYQVWGDSHEELEDLADEIQDLLDGMEGFHG